MVALSLLSSGFGPTWPTAHRKLLLRVQCLIRYLCRWGSLRGSILGPLFFLIFINDLPFYLSSVSNVSLTMFADDTTILTTGSSVQLNLNQLAAEVSNWANINRMALNATKTKSMLVSSPQKLNTSLSQSLNVAVNDSKVEQVTEAKILGVTFDHTLSWKRHVETLCKKLNSRITLLGRIQTSLHYYNACIHSQLVYCSSVWGTCSQTLLLCLLRAQKRAARLILQGDCSTPSVSLFSTLHWIPVCDIIKYKKTPAAIFYSS